MTIRTGPSDGMLVAAVVANGLLVGAALDQSIKQLPARHRIGVTAYSAYSQAADLRNGVAFYATLGWELRRRPWPRRCWPAATGPRCHARGGRLPWRAC